MKLVEDAEAAYVVVRVNSLLNKVGGETEPVKLISNTTDHQTSFFLSPFPIGVNNNSSYSGVFIRRTLYPLVTHGNFVISGRPN